MRVTREQAAANRTALLDAASRLFRERGIDGVGVADIAKAAGLTHGALYAHFASKEDLAAAAFTHGSDASMARARRRPRGSQPAFADLLDALLSTTTRDRLATGCPMAASASEIARQGRGMSACFARGFADKAGMVEATLDRALSPARKRQLALATIAAEVGAVAVSRAIRKADPALADEVLRAVRTVLASAPDAGDDEAGDDEAGLCPGPHQEPGAPGPPTA